MKFFVYLFLSLLALVAQADEIRPAYLEVKESQVNHYDFLLKLPIKGNKAFPIVLNVPTQCTSTLKTRNYRVNGAVLKKWSMQCKEGLRGQTLSFNGMSGNNTDVLVRLEFFDGQSQSVLLTPSNTSYTITEESSSFEIIKTYTGLGITHILLGFDHLLFVFALLLIVKNLRRLLWTITAFTLSHSITMISATLGLFNVPQKPVEAIIALSIMFLAMEIIHEKQGKVGLTSSFPWLIAFIFGLLHGFGFAGALAEIGLPQNAITLALIFFNIGVEIGQLVFILSIVFISMAFRKLQLLNLVKKIKPLMVYAIGGLASFWFIERLSSF